MPYKRGILKKTHNETMNENATSERTPGKSRGRGADQVELTERFPDEQSAVEWFEGLRWPNGRHCPKCENTGTRPVASGKPMPYWCKGCRSYFSVRTGTVIRNSPLPLLKWQAAVYLYVANLGDVSSMKLHRDLNITQASAWFMLQRLREVDASVLRGAQGSTVTANTKQGISQ